jgi:hypothetical protein
MLCGEVLLNHPNATRPRQVGLDVADLPTLPPCRAYPTLPRLHYAGTRDKWHKKPTGKRIIVVDLPPDMFSPAALRPRGHDLRKAQVEWTHDR